MKYLLALTVVLLASTANADFYTISGTGLFDTNLGTLNKVTVRFKGDNVSLGNAATHNHTITSTTVGYSFSSSIASLGFTVLGTADGLGGFNLTTTAAGSHDHDFSLPSFNWNSKPINLNNAITSSVGGTHSHDITGLTIVAGFGNSGTGTISGGTVVSGDTHAQTFSYDQSVEFSGSDLSLFLTGGGPNPNYSFNLNVPGESHTHILNSGTFTAVDGNNTQFQVSLTSNILLSTNNSGAHSVNINDNVFSTTFEYSPTNAVPEPSSMLLLSAFGGMGYFGRRFLRRKKK